MIGYDPLSIDIYEVKFDSVCARYPGWYGGSFQIDYQKRKMMSEIKQVPNTILSDGLSVVVPMYNEVENAAPLVTEIKQALQTQVPLEIIIVDDGSQDGTYEQLVTLQKDIPELRIVRHKKNFGQSAGIYTGVKAAQYPWIATLDGDGQNDPADIPVLIAELNAYSDNKQSLLLVGNRNKRNDSPVRLLSSRIANNVRKSLLRDDCPDTGCGLKLFPRQAFLQIPHFNHLHRFLPALFKRAGGHVLNIPVNHRPRTRGQSKYGVMNRLWVGIVDLFGVVWLIRRPCAPQVDDGRD